MTALSGDGAISKRHVFYIPGFDPRGPRHYHTLYRENAARQAAVNGWALDIGPRRKLGDFVHRWAVRGAGVETTYDFLAWDDIVRANWRGGVKARLRDLLGFYGSRVIVDLVPPVARQSPRRLLTGFYPLLSLLLLVALCVLAFVLIAAAGNWAAMSILLAAAAAAILWAAGVMLAERCAVFWLLKIFSFCARWGRGEIPALNARAGLFADHIASVLNKTDAQEVMIVGHSIGAEVYEQPILADGNDVVIEAGMVINIETPYYEFGVGAVHVENPFVVAESGPNVVLTSGSSRELVVLS